MKALDWHLKSIKIVWESLKSNRFWLYFIPGILVLILFALIRGFISLFFNAPLAGTEEEAVNNWLVSSWNSVGNGLNIFLKHLFIFTVITLLSPFNTLLSEKLDCYLTKQTFKFTFSRMLSDFMRMLGIVMIALILELILLFIWWIISKIFGFSDTYIYTVFSWLVSAFFFGFSFYDHSLERYRIRIGGSLNFAFKNIGIVLLTGLLFKGLYYFPYLWDTPIIGIIVSPVITTMVSTVVYLFYNGKLLSE